MQIKVLMIVCLIFTSSQLCAKTSNQSKINISKNDIKCVAETLYSETRGESLIGQLAVGATIVTRSKKIFHKPACNTVHQQYTQKKIPSEDKQKFMLLASNILMGNAKNPIGDMDSFDSFKGRYSKRPKNAIKIGGHWFYKALNL